MLMYSYSSHIGELALFAVVQCATMYIMSIIIETPLGHQSLGFNP